MLLDPGARPRGPACIAGPRVPGRAAPARLRRRHRADARRPHGVCHRQLDLPAGAAGCSLSAPRARRRAHRHAGHGAALQALDLRAARRWHGHQRSVAHRGAVRGPVAPHERHPRGRVLWGEHRKGFRSEYVPAFFAPLYPRLQEIKPPSTRTTCSTPARSRRRRGRRRPGWTAYRREARPIVRSPSPSASRTRTRCIATAMRRASTTTRTTRCARPGRPPVIAGIRRRAGRR